MSRQLKNWLIGLLALVCILITADMALAQRQPAWRVTFVCPTPVSQGGKGTFVEVFYSDARAGQAIRAFLAADGKHRAFPVKVGASTEEIQRAERNRAVQQQQEAQRRAQLEQESKQREAKARQRAEEQRRAEEEARRRAAEDKLRAEQQEQRDLENRIDKNVQELAEKKQPHDNGETPQNARNRLDDKLTQIASQQPSGDETPNDVRNRLDDKLNRLPSNRPAGDDTANQRDELENRLDNQLARLNDHKRRQNEEGDQNDASNRRPPLPGLIAQKLDELKNKTATNSPETQLVSQDTPIDDLRRQQEADLNKLRDDLRNRANQPGADLTELVDEYKNKKQAIQNKYNEMDTRNRRLADTLARTGAENTGSYTKDVRADIDTAGNRSANDRMLQDMQARGQQVDITASKIVNRTDDHTHWREPTPEGQAEKAKDPDSYKTTGGQQAVGNSSEVKDARGEMIDHRSKLEHARADGDSKTMGKGVVKSADAADGVKFDPNAKTMIPVYDPETGKPMLDDSGKPVMKESKHNGAFVKDKGSFVNSVGGDSADIYKQASDLKNYGDGLTSGITSPGDTPEVENKKINDWADKASDLGKKAQEVGDRRGDIREKVRQNFADSYDNANQFDSDQRKLDRDAASRIEADRAKVRETNKIGQNFLDGELVKPTAKEFHHGGWKDKPHVDADVAKPKAQSDLAGAFDLGAQLGRAGVETLSEAASENRDLEASDVIGFVDKATGFSGIKNMAENISRDEQIKVERGQQGQGRALLNTGVRMVDGAARGLINDPVDLAIRDEEAQAAREGREPNYWKSTYNGAARVGGEITGMNAAFEGIAEGSHIESHAAAGAQQAALQQFIQSERNLSHKRLDTLRRQVAEMQSSGQANSSAMQQAIGEYQDHYNRLKRFDDAADRYLGVDGRTDPYGMNRQEAAKQKGIQDFSRPYSTIHTNPDELRREFGHDGP